MRVEGSGRMEIVVSAAGRLVSPALARAANRWVNRLFSVVASSSTFAYFTGIW